MGQSVNRTVLRIPGMDCPADEQLVRMALSPLPQVDDIRCDLVERTVAVLHDGRADPLLAALTPLRMKAQVASSGPAPQDRSAVADEGDDRRVLWIVLAINAAMFVVELVVGLWAQSAGLLADSIDMLADASVYGIALAAVGGTLAAQRRAAMVSGWFQLALALLVLVEVARRSVSGSEPLSAAIMVTGALALAANTASVVLVAPHRRDGVHLRASWIFSINDTLANAGLIAAGALVAITGSAVPDLIMGTAISLLVASGAWRTLRMASSAADGGEAH